MKTACKLLLLAGLAFLPASSAGQAPPTEAKKPAKAKKSDAKKADAKPVVVPFELLASGHMAVQVKVNGKSLSGHGASTDIVEASARALVNALNKARHADRLESSSLNSVYLWGV